MVTVFGRAGTNQSFHRANSRQATRIEKIFAQCKKIMYQSTRCAALLNREQQFNIAQYIAPHRHPSSGVSNPNRRIPHYLSERLQLGASLPINLFTVPRRRSSDGASFLINPFTVAHRRLSSWTHRSSLTYSVVPRRRDSNGASFNIDAFIAPMSQII